MPPGENQNSGVSFEEASYAVPAYAKQEGGLPGMAGFLSRLTGGAISNKAQADVVLIIVATLSFFASGYLFLHRGPELPVLPTDGSVLTLPDEPPRLLGTGLR